MAVKLECMKWYCGAAKALARGEKAQIRPRGHSMSGRIEDNQLVQLEPVSSCQLQLGDIVLARVPGKNREIIVLHQILEREEERVLIGANNGRVDGWSETSAVLGRAILGE